MVLFTYIFVIIVYPDMMRFFTTLFILFFFIPAVFSQSKIEKNSINFNGQWKGNFVDNSASMLGWGGEKIDYVLELETNGSSVTGYSYTYFMDGGKRYYTICKLRGTLNKATKEVSVTEYERTKYNTPPDIRNCFQTHTLKYIKENTDSESLQGAWKPAPNQNGDCGFGKTALVKRTLKKFTPLNNKAVVLTKKPPINNSPSQKTTSKTLPANQKNATKKPIPETVKKDQPPKKVVPPKTDTVVKRQTNIPPVKRDELVIVPKIKFEKRLNSVLKYLQIDNQTFSVDFYDNGSVDGDSISVFFNGKLVLSNKMLSEKPLTLTLTADKDKEVNELVMYAENLGEIPPNTALMIVRDGEKRYEVRITSDNEKNGTIRFTYTPKN